MSNIHSSMNSRHSPARPTYWTSPTPPSARIYHISMYVYIYMNIYVDI